jgi:hypothetical protein
VTLDEAGAAIGRSVVYVEKHGDEERREAGVIVSRNDYFVFVRYGNDKLSKATRAEDLVIDE